MRIARLDLARYGRFTNHSIELPAADPDLHILFGPNEAGKSTAMTALEDLLFGIPHNSPLNFLHDYPDMRIGARLEHDGERLDLRRRKGNKDTLLAVDDTPLPGGEVVLAGLLAGADRSFFERMFSLDHRRLRTGGHDMLDARNEVGQMLFAAGTGIAGLRERLKGLEDEAASLWAPRRAASRKFYQIQDALQAADTALREHTLTARTWQELRRALDTSSAELDAVEREVRDATVELRRLQRIRRVLGEVRRLADVDQALAGFGEIPRFPPDARQRLEAARQADTRAGTLLETLTPQLQAVRQAQAALTVDTALLQRTDDIAVLHEHRIQVTQGAADLLERKAELVQVEQEFLHRAAELGWDGQPMSALSDRIPSRADVSAVRNLLSERGRVQAELDAARTALDEADELLGVLAERLAGVGAPVDVTVLAAQIRAIRAAGDPGARIAAAESESRDTRAAVEARLARLRPNVPDSTLLATMAAPPRDTVQRHRDALRDLEARFEGSRERLGELQRTLEAKVRARERLSRDEALVAPEDLARARAHRDAGWALVRRRHVRGEPVAEEEIAAFTGGRLDLASSYEAAVAAADASADERFDKAEAAGRLTLLGRDIAAEEDRLAGLREDAGRLERELADARQGWSALWADLPFEPDSPDAMLDWITDRAEILEHAERSARAERNADSIRSEQAQARDELLTELARIGEALPGLAGQSLAVVLEAAAEAQLRHEKLKADRVRLDEQRQRAEGDRERRAQALAQAERRIAGWQRRWTDAVRALAIAAGQDCETVAAQLEVIDELRALAARARELREQRIGAIEGFRLNFESEVAALVGAVAPDLAGRPAPEAVVELECRLEAARAAQSEQARKAQEVGELEAAVEKHLSERREAADTVGHLRDMAGVEGMDALRELIDRDERRRALESERAALLETLARQGDGLTPEQLAAECAGADPDRIGARAEALEVELEALRQRQMQARDRKHEAAGALDAVAAGEGAARAAADRQAALAQITDVAGRYVRVRSAALLLRWAIDRYRREKQAPLLRRTGELFEILTEGSFTGLRPEFDDQDRMRLAGVRPGGETVPVQGMSDGTVDQLYLALRVASVEDYLTRARALPFVADDLFINFDDARATAGLRVLADLARHTQVLFFTHHRHLLDLAADVLGAAANVVELPGGGGARRS